MVNYNRRELLHSCLRSLMAQTVPPVEVIVVDNASTDGSVEMIGREFANCPIRVLQNSTNRGFCAANNQGFSVARAPLVALLNNDAEAHPDWLARLATPFADAAIGMTASKVLVYEDPRRIDKVGHLIFLDGQNRGRGTGELDLGQYDRMEEVLWPDGCAAIYRRAMIEQIGGFDEDFFAYADDAELGLRARIAGWRCIYVPTAVVRHHRGATLGVRSTRRIELIERNRILLVVKLFPWSLLWLNGAFYAARLAAGAWAALTGKGEISRYPGWRSKLQVALAMVRGDLQALLLLPKMWAKRRHIEPIRKLTPAQVRQLLITNSISLRELSQQAI